MNICQCGAGAGYPHDRDCPYPLYRGSDAEVEKWQSDYIAAKPRTSVYTTAPESYDGFGTQTLQVLGHEKRGGRVLRQVQVLDEYLDWQRGRYLSGMYEALLQKDWDLLKGLILELDDETEFGEDYAAHDQELNGTEDPADPCGHYA